MLKINTLLQKYYLFFIQSSNILLISEAETSLPQLSFFLSMQEDYIPST